MGLDRIKPCVFASDNFCVYNSAMAKQRERSRSKRGRPKKSAEERLEQRLDVRVSGEEKAAFKLAAKTANQDLSVWIRITLKQAIGEQPVDAGKSPRG